MYLSASSNIGIRIIDITQFIQIDMNIRCHYVGTLSYLGGGNSTMTIQCRVLKLSGNTCDKSMKLQYVRIVCDPSNVNIYSRVLTSILNLYFASNSCYSDQRVIMHYKFLWNANFHEVVQL
jgi:hypothetical protein